MVGNAAAALQGAPVTTIDIDFMFKKTAMNMKKLKFIAGSLRANIFKQWFPAADLFRVVNEDQGLQLDFMSQLHGVRSFEGLRGRATAVAFGQHTLLIASLADIIKSKRAAGRSRDLAVLEILEKTLHEQQSREGEKNSADNEGP